MVYKPPVNLRNRFDGPCDKVPKVKRTLAMGVKIEQRAWKPTVRRGKVAAEAIPGTPSYKAVPQLLGPNIIDSKKKSAPAYTMRKKTQVKRESFLEGPAKYDLYGTSKNGIHKPPAFTMVSRKSDFKKYIGPGANRYDINNSYEASKKSVPRYSFGKKPVAFKTLPTPGANVYNLPPVFGTAKEGKLPAAPAFSLIGREKPRNIPAFILPGPGQYEDNSRAFAKTLPKYSLRSKHKVITDEHMKPGPAAHCPEKYMKHKSVPAPSFSIHHTPYLGLRKAYLIPECTPLAPVPEWTL